MRKTFLAALLCAGTSASFAQAPTLTAANMNPFLGDTYVNNICDTTGVVPGPSGTGKMWTFSGLVPAFSGTTIDTASAEACALTPTCALFSATSPASDVAIVTPAASTIDYLITGTTKLQHKGYYNSPGQNAIYTDPIDQFQYPFNYGGTFSDACAGTIVFTPSGSSTPITAAETSTVTVTYDGYGTLVLPGPATYTNVARVHSSQSFADNADVFGTGTPVTVTYQLETYSWYLPGYHSPLLTIATAVGDIFNYKVVSYSAKKLRTAVEHMPGIDNSLAIFPNPATNLLNVQFNVTNREHVRVSLTDMLGREAAVLADNDAQGAQNLSLNTNGMAKGIYVLRLQSGTETVARKIEIQ